MLLAAMVSSAAEQPHAEITGHECDADCLERMRLDQARRAVEQLTAAMEYLVLRLHHPGLQRVHPLGSVIDKSPHRVLDRVELLVDRACGSAYVGLAGHGQCLLMNKRDF